MRSRGSHLSLWKYLPFKCKHRPLLVYRENTPPSLRPDVSSTQCCLLDLLRFANLPGWTDGMRRGCSECSAILNHAQNRVRGERVASKGNNGGRAQEKAHEMDVSEERGGAPTLTHPTDTLDINQWTVNGPFSCVRKCPGSAVQPGSNHGRGLDCGARNQKKNSQPRAYLLWSPGGNRGVVGFNPTSRNLSTRQNPGVPTFIFPPVLGIE